MKYSPERELRPVAGSLALAEIDVRMLEADEAWEIIGSDGPEFLARLAARRDRLDR